MVYGRKREKNKKRGGGGRVGLLHPSHPPVMSFYMQSLQAESPWHLKRPPSREETKTEWQSWLIIPRHGRRCCCRHCCCSAEEQRAQQGEGMLEGGQCGRQGEDRAAPGPPVRRAVGRPVVRWAGRSDPRYGRGTDGVMRGSRPHFVGYHAATLAGSMGSLYHTVAGSNVLPRKARR